MLLQEIGVYFIQQLPTPCIYIDNTTTEVIAHHPELHNTTKHFEIDLHTIRDKLIIGNTVLCHVYDADYVGDLFTIPLNGDNFRQLTNKLGLLSLRINLSFSFLFFFWNIPIIGQT